MSLFSLNTLILCNLQYNLGDTVTVHALRCFYFFPFFSALLSPNSLLYSPVLPTHPHIQMEYKTCHARTPVIVLCLLSAVPHRPIRVSGSSETKTYGKDVVLREHRERHTLPRRSLFGKDVVRARVFNALHVLFSPTEGLFSGKLSASYRGRWSITPGAGFIGKNTSLQVSEIARVLRYRRF